MREQVADQQAGRSLGAHVHVVADPHPLRGKCEDVDRAGAVESRAEHRPGDLPQEDQPIDRSRRLASEPCGLPGALVDRGERACAALAVVHDEDGS